MDLTNLSDEQLQKLQTALTPKTNKYIPITPTPKQTAALLMNNVRELLYGGAVGGGKSVYQLAAALQYVDVPGYNAILFRKTFADLMLPGALIPMSQNWLSPFIKTGEVVWKDKDKRYIFKESGATLSFGYLDVINDHFRYQGAEFSYIGFDEVTHIAPESFEYLFSRLRKPKEVKVPLRVRATANPGGVYGDYYYQRYFVDNLDANGKPKRIFLPAGLNDNPYLDSEEYMQALENLPPILREQLLNGNWEVRESGDIFNKAWLMVCDRHNVPKNARRVRFWDFASIDPKYRKKNTNTKDPDWTVGFKMAHYQGMYYIEDIVAVQKTPNEVEKLMQLCAQGDGHACAIRFEQEGGSSGEANALRICREVLPGYDVAGVKPVVSKIERARPVAAAMQMGSIFIVRDCREMLRLYNQLDSFPLGAHDDVIDAMDGAFSFFTPAEGRIVAPTSNRRGAAKRAVFRLGQSYWKK